MVTAVFKKDGLYIIESDVKISNPKINVTEEMLDRLKKEQQFFFNQKRRSLGFSIVDDLSQQKLEFPKDSNLINELKKLL
jgi:hypothetical protein